MKDIELIKELGGIAQQILRTKVTETCEMVHDAANTGIYAEHILVNDKQEEYPDPFVAVFAIGVSKDIYTDPAELKQLQDLCKKFRDDLRALSEARDTPDNIHRNTECNYES